MDLVSGIEILSLPCVPGGFSCSDPQRSPGEGRPERGRPQEVMSCSQKWAGLRREAHFPRGRGGAGRPVQVSLYLHFPVPLRHLLIFPMGFSRVLSASRPSLKIAVSSPHLDTSASVILPSPAASSG